MNYAELAFTSTIKEFQESLGSRSGYARMEKTSYVNGLTDYEISFIQNMDSFYLASYGDGDFPFIQNSSAKRGFIKVIDNSTIGIVALAGKRNHILEGNIANNPKVSLIMVAYPQRARLKIYAEAQVIEIKDNDKLIEFLEPLDYELPVERMIVFKIQAYDWNCPQHITPRYTVEEFEEVFSNHNKHILDLEEKIHRLESQLSEK